MNKLEAVERKSKLTTEYTKKRGCEECGALIKNKNKTGLCNEHTPRRLTHGMSGTRIHKIWEGMKRRCNHTKSINYPRYGGSGIKLSEEWDRDFAAFYRDMGGSYFESATIDRIDNSKGYSKENCRWVLASEQSKNRRVVHKITHQGESKTIQEWAASLNIKAETLYARIFTYNWSVEKSLTMPVLSAVRSNRANQLAL